MLHEFIRPKRKRETLVSSVVINLHEAALCAEDHLFVIEDGRNVCPKCGTSSWMRIADCGLAPVAPKLALVERDYRYDAV